MKRSQLVAAAVAALTTLITLGVVELVDTDGDGRTDQVTVKIPKSTAAGGGLKAVPGQPGTVKAADQVEVEVPKSQLDAIGATGLADHEGQKDETPGDALQTPGGVQQLKEAQEQRERIRERQEPLPTAGASAGFAGCVTRFVRNQSSRNGVRPQLQVLHYTVSPNRPGWSDVNSIVSFFNSPSSQASSNFVIDREGNCAYIVPVEAKSWTQAGANSISVSYEVINSGREGTFMDSPGYRKLASVAKQVASRTGVPAKAGATNGGCGVRRKGLVQHKDFGICGGGHVDITPYSSGQVIRIIESGAPAATATVRSHLTAYNRKILDRRFYHWKGYHQSTGKLKADHLRHSRDWAYFARRQKKRYDAAHAAGEAWSHNGIGTQRLAMARTERFNQADRAYLRK